MIRKNFFLFLFHKVYFQHYYYFFIYSSSGTNQFFFFSSHFFLSIRSSNKNQIKCFQEFPESSMLVLLDYGSHVIVVMCFTCLRVRLSFALYFRYDVSLFLFLRHMIRCQRQETHKILPIMAEINEPFASSLPSEMLTKALKILFFFASQFIWIACDKLLLRLSLN